MDEPVWLDRLVVDAVHLDQLREHGGLQGVRDENALESGGLATSSRLCIGQFRPTWSAIILVGSSITKNVEDNTMGRGQDHIAVADRCIIKRKLPSVSRAISDPLPGLKLLSAYDSAVD